MGCISPTSQLHLNKYTIKKQYKIAQGAYGDIWRCKTVPSQGTYALKQIRLQNSELETMYSKEVRMLNKLTQQKVKGSISLKDSHITMQGKQKIGCLLFELGSATLYEELRSKIFTETEILGILKDICQSLEEIHSLGIYHLDLKPQNIVLVGKRYKLGDFGSAIDMAIDFDQLQRKKAASFIQYIQANSTLSYRSPEMIEPLGKVVASASDIWMLGCVAYLLTFRKHPFENEGKLAIITGNVKYPKQGFLTDLIKEMLCLDYKARPSAKTLGQKIDSQLRKRLQNKT